MEEVKISDIGSVSELKGTGSTLAFASSGGLDSCTITRWLVDQGVDVVSITADLGQPDEDNIDDIEGRMLASGASGHHVVPLQESLAESGLKLVQAQATYEGGYWNTTGVARHVTVKGLVEKMNELDISILAHGATGRGNDQIRFQLITHMLNPSIKLYAPWRDNEYLDTFRGRAEMIDFCEAKGLPIKATREKPYSTDANFLGLTHEAGTLESLETPADFVTPGMGVYPEHAPDEPEQFVVKFEKGRPTQINGESVDLVSAFKMANEIGGRNGVGIGVHVVENRIMGLKSRGVYEQPGIMLLGKCYEFLLQLILDRPARRIFNSVSQDLGEIIYNGLGYDLSAQMGFSALEPVTNVMTGTITVSIKKGHAYFAEAKDVAHNMYLEEATSMEAVGDFDHNDSEGLVRVLGIGARANSTSNIVTGYGI